VNVSEERYPLDQALISDSTPQIQVALEGLEDPEYLPPNVVAAYKARLETKLEDNIDSDIYRETKAKKGLIAEFSASVSRGEKTKAEIENRYKRADNEFYTAAMYKSDLKHRTAYESRKKEATDTRQFLMDNVGRGISHKDPDLMSEVNGQVEAVIEQFRQNNPDAQPQQVAQAKLEIGLRAVRAWKVIPDALENEIIAGNNSDDPAQRETALHAYTAVNTIAPQSLGQIPESNLEELARAAAMVTDGYSAKAALDSARTWNAMTPAQKEAQKEEVRRMKEKSQMTTGTMANVLVSFAASDKSGYASQFGGGDLGDRVRGWTGSYTIPTEMFASYARNVESELIKSNGNSAVALRSAWNLTKRMYSPTTINGRPELTRKALTEVPEEWARKDMLAQGLPEDAIIFSDVQTVNMTDRGQVPSYAVVALDELSGAISFPRYTPDVAQFKKESLARQDRKHKEVREQKEALREMNKAALETKGRRFSGRNKAASVKKTTAKKTNDQSLPRF